MHIDSRWRQHRSGWAGARRRAAAIACDLLWISAQVAHHRQALLDLIVTRRAGLGVGRVQTYRDRAGQRDRAATLLLREAEE